MSVLDELRKNCSEDVLALNQDIFTSPSKGGDVGQSKRSKYANRKVKIDGIPFDSDKEARRYLELTEMQLRHEISQLQLQVKYVLQEAMTGADGKRIRAITYKADFVYAESGHLIIEDVKSIITAKSESFRLRWRMLQAKFKDDPRIICKIRI